MTTTSMTAISKNNTHNINAGGKRYFCPWNDYSSTSFWSTYGHAIKCAYKHGYFNVPIAMIKAGIRLR